MQDSSAFGTAEQAIINAFELRLVTPDVGEARGFTDLQGKCQGFWLTLLLFKETVRNIHEDDGA